MTDTTPTIAPATEPSSSSLVNNPVAKTPAPYRQIRAHYDSETITVYQAYNATIAAAAVAHQSLNASPLFQLSRMTWIKPSWTWMMYRSGYSHKDANQSRILALKMTHANFQTLLRHATLAQHGSSRTAGVDVVVQWDPERSVRIGRLEYRSIQVGISRKLSETWVREWIVSIEDVTDVARRLKERLDGDDSVERDQLVKEGLVPEERVYDVPEDIRENLEMGKDENEGNAASRDVNEQAHSS